jgi:predicted DNA-binding protein
VAAAGKWIDMFEIKINPQLERRLADAARTLGEDPDRVALRALETYLEDVEDYARAAAAWSRHDPSRSVSLDEMRRELGLED